MEPEIFDVLCRPCPTLKDYLTFQNMQKGINFAKWKESRIDTLTNLLKFCWARPSSVRSIIHGLKWCISKSYVYRRFILLYRPVFIKVNWERIKENDCFDCVRKAKYKMTSSYKLNIHTSLGKCLWLESR